jgi:SAM-dependent methyltransferase
MSSPVTTTFDEDVERGDRFEFGKNWARFLSVLDEERIGEACRSLKEMLGVASLAGRTFVDIGSGSGLFSLAAMRLGAARVRSFDYDPSSVACGHALKGRFFPEATTWSIERGSALDPAYLASLGQFDVVYSWGVLHHTGQMWRALQNVTEMVRDEGLLFIAIYRDQGWLTTGWRAVKRLYNSGRLGRALILGTFCPFFAAQGVIADVIRLKNPMRRYAEYKRSRGMSRVHDWVDWLGGLPFEVASADELFAFFKRRGFHLENMRLSDGHGCNQLVFARTRGVASSTPAALTRDQTGVP